MGCGAVEAMGLDNWVMPDFGILPALYALPLFPSPFHPLSLEKRSAEDGFFWVPWC